MTICPNIYSLYTGYFAGEKCCISTFTWTGGCRLVAILILSNTEVVTGKKLQMYSS